MDADPPRFVTIPDPDGRTRWRVDAAFLTSRWTCIWGDGCQGIHDSPCPELRDGCCSVGVVLVDEDEAMTISALAATIDPTRFAKQAHAERVHHVDGAWRTTVVDGACVFLNPADFAGGAGCALHLAALDDGDDPLDWKPQTCTRMPIRVDEHLEADGVTEVTVRAWRRDDWGPGGETMAWWCTESDDAYRATTPVVERLAPELRVLFGDDGYDRVRARLIDEDPA